jgi:hypothetical protein
MDFNPDELAGWIDYYSFPQLREGRGGPFNGQQRRRELFNAILREMKPVAIVETGTFQGDTTELFGETGLPVYSVESNARNYGFARARLRHCGNVVMLKCDSRDGLLRILGNELRDRLNETTFFYLDAHWNAYLPLADELDIIFNRANRAIVMIDDFEVPGDGGYGYDDYGEACVLSGSYIESHILKFGLAALYPKATSGQESGARRGCVILCKDGVANEIRRVGLTFEV